MEESALIERLEQQAAEIASLREQLKTAVATAKKLAELEGKENELTDQNEALRRAVDEQNEIIENMTAPIRDIAERLDSITKAAGRVDAVAIESVNAQLERLNANAAATAEKMRCIPSAIHANWLVVVACVIITAAGVWYCSTQSKAAADAARQAVWGIYTRPDAQGRSHSAIENSADWQNWHEAQQKAAP